MKARTMGRTIEIPDEMVRAAKQPGRSDGPQPEKAWLASTVGPGPQSASPSPLPGWPKEHDKWNYNFCLYLDKQRAHGLIRWFWYEPFSLWLVPPSKHTKERGLRHKVDFCVWRNDGALEMIEVKGRSKNLRDGITRYKIAKERFPCFIWKIVRLKNGDWEEFSV